MREGREREGEGDVRKGERPKHGEGEVREVGRCKGGREWREKFQSKTELMCTTSIGQKIIYICQ